RFWWNFVDQRRSTDDAISGTLDLHWLPTGSQWELEVHVVVREAHELLSRVDTNRARFWWIRTNAQPPRQHTRRRSDFLDRSDDALESIEVSGVDGIIVKRNHDRVGVTCSRVYCDSVSNTGFADHSRRNDIAIVFDDVDSRR